MVRAWDQEVCSLCGLRFEPCGCSYDGHRRLTWSLTSGPVGLVEVHASWPGHPRSPKKNKQMSTTPKKKKKCPPHFSHNFSLVSLPCHKNLMPIYTPILVLHAKTKFQLRLYQKHLQIFSKKTS